MPPKKAKKPPAPKRYLISLRVSHEIARKLQAAAIASERGLAAEAENRIEQTFRLSETAELDALRLRYGPFLGVLMLAGEAADLTGFSEVGSEILSRKEAAGEINREDKSDPDKWAKIVADSSLAERFAWLNSPVAYRNGIAAATLIFQAFAPPDDSSRDVSPSVTADWWVSWFASRQLRDVRYKPDLKIIRSLLGDLINRLPPRTPTEPHSPPDPK
jgi:hypothetical protein